MLQEAAFELFLEQGYAGTTVDQIATRAGVSRGTFFNYFSGKSDVFWIDLDDVFDDIAARLRNADDSTEAMTTVHGVLVAAAARFGPGDVPWALTQHGMLGSVNELQAAAMSRLSSHARTLSEFLVRRTGNAEIATAAAYAVLGGCVAAAQRWAAAGPGRGSFVPFVDAAIGPVCSGFSAALESRPSR